MGGPSVNSANHHSRQMTFADLLLAPARSSEADDGACRRAICLFSSAGLGELGIRANGIEIVASSEVIKNRHDLYAHNYPTTRCFHGDIWETKDGIIQYWQTHFADSELFMLYATPPCQGMSSNGAGKLAFEQKEGRRSAVDERNRLVIPALDVIATLRPRWVLFENVPRMKDTSIPDENGRYVNIIALIRERLGGDYDGGCEILACHNYGIPQFRRRLITVFTRDPSGVEYYHRNGGSFFPAAEKLPQVTLRQAIAHLPQLDAVSGNNTASDFHPLHYVPIMKPEKYHWVSHTPEGQTAYNNQCINPDCLHTGNALHRDVNNDGVWQSNKGTPIVCEKCGSLLPRPSMLDKATGKRRLIKGFHSAYRRMKWDRPANTITQNFIFEASDNKIHPEQNRVLSAYEALILQTVAEYDYDFCPNGNWISLGLFAELLGESVPPRLIDLIVRKMIAVSDGQSQGLSTTASTATNAQSVAP